MGQTIVYQGKEWMLICSVVGNGVCYDEYYCFETNECLQIWDDGYKEIFECD